MRPEIYFIVLDKLGEVIVVYDMESQPPLTHYYLSNPLRIGRTGRAMGMGDFKLMGMFGAWLGWRALVFILLFASIQAVLAAVIMKLVGVKLRPPLPEEWEEEEV